MTEPASHQKPSRRPAAMADLEFLVRPPGNPMDIRAYTAAERADAELYAAAVGGQVETLG